jgi:hypothetical protein
MTTSPIAPTTLITLNAVAEAATTAATPAAAQQPPAELPEGLALHGLVARHRGKDEVIPPPVPPPDPSIQPTLERDVGERRSALGGRGAAQPLIPQPRVAGPLGRHRVGERRAVLQLAELVSATGSAVPGAVERRPEQRVGQIGGERAARGGGRELQRAVAG